METREELLNGLREADSIINQLSNIQQRLTQVRSQYRSTIPNKKMKLWVKILLIVLLIMMLFSSTVDKTIWDMIWGILFGVLEIAVVYFVIKFYYKWKNQKIDSQNEQILRDNANAQEKEKAVLGELQQAQTAYQERVSWWYPENYCSLDAVGFFYNAVKNHRADSMKEAINLYETELHQRRVEDNQQQALQQQKLNNLLAAGSLVMQGAQLNEMNRHNAVTEVEMQHANWKLDDISSRLRH